MPNTSFIPWPVYCTALFHSVPNLRHNQKKGSLFEPQFHFPVHNALLLVICVAVQEANHGLTLQIWCVRLNNRRNTCVHVDREQKQSRSHQNCFARFVVLHKGVETYYFVTPFIVIQIYFSMSIFLISAYAVVLRESPAAIEFYSDA